MTFLELSQAYLAELHLEHIRDYAARGRPFAAVSVEQLSARWLEMHRIVRALADEGREGELIDLRSEFDLRDIEPPMHLVAAETALARERLLRRIRECVPDPAEVEQTEAELLDFYARLHGPKH